MVEVVYDIYQELHKGNKESQENPERINVIVNYLKNLNQNIKINEFNELIDLKKYDWNNNIKLNCSSCTFVLEDNLCKICYSKQTHKWKYVGQIDGDTTFETPFTEIILSRAIKIIEISINKLILNENKIIFCLLRPPSHHSCLNKKAGFCHLNFDLIALDLIYNNFHKNTIIIDIDAHHGDGTEYEINKRNYGYYISIHGYGENIYPKTGEYKNNSKILNIPLSEKDNDNNWLYNFNLLIYPKIIELSPEFIIISCGFDGCYKDITSPLTLTENLYLEFSKIIAKLNIPVLCILKGGYYLDSLGILSENIIKPFL